MIGRTMCRTTRGGLRRGGAAAMVAVALAVGLLVAGAAPAAAQTTGSWGSHVVQPGESLTSIAAQYCTTSWGLQYVNNLSDPDRIYAGQSLTVPLDRCGYAPGKPPPSGGVYDRGPTEHARGSVSGGVYTVAWGDTVYSITQRFGVTEAELRAANGMGASATIYAGQRLTIPGLGTAPPDGRCVITPLVPIPAYTFPDLGSSVFGTIPAGAAVYPEGRTGNWFIISKAVFGDDGPEPLYINLGPGAATFHGDCHF